MSTLAEAFKQEAMRRKDEQVWQTLGLVVERAMWPFKPNHISLELAQDSNLYDFGRTLWVTLDILPEHPFKYKFDEKYVMQAYFPEDVFLQSVCEPLFNHFRYRPALPVDDHIILGEE